MPNPFFLSISIKQRLLNVRGVFDYGHASGRRANGPAAEPPVARSTRRSTTRALQEHTEAAPRPSGCILREEGDLGGFGSGGEDEDEENYEQIRA